MVLKLGIRLTNQEMKKNLKNMLKNIDWFSAVQSLLDYRQQQQLSALLPEIILGIVPFSAKEANCMRISATSL